MHWIYVQGKGITSADGEVELLFDAPRPAIRALLGFDEKKNKGRSLQEDQYGKSLENPAHWVRLGFSEKGGLLQEIEVLAGTVEVDGVKIEAYDGDLKKALAALKKKGYSFKKGDYSYTDFEHFVDIGESGANGAEKRYRTAWIFLSRSFDHLKV